MDRSRFAGSPVGTLVPFVGTDGRTGRPFSHVAFVADPLGGEPQLAARSWHAVGEARAAIAALDTLTTFVPNAQLLRAPSLRREAQSTSALEGTFAPLKDVVAGRSTTTGSRSSELAEVLNYVEAAESVFHALTSGSALSFGLVAGAHRLLVHETESDGPDAGRVRRGHVVIGSPTGTVEDARFVPMPPGAPLEAAARDIFDWISTAVDGGVDPVVACALTHYQFETVHPFNDGNGRLGRLLIVAQLMTTGLLRVPLLTVSPWFESRRSEYQDQLANVSAGGGWDAWVQFFATGLAASAKDTIARIEGMLAAHREAIDRLNRAGMGAVARAIVDVLLEQPLISASQLVARTGRSSAAVYAQVKRLVDIGVLSGPYGSYDRLYVADAIWSATQR
ncbi:Fic family protein [Cellulomonas fimi]|uniref:Fic family protein n=1 Tax=Cellulomonas fimi TaxID=1708 RepID=UPI00235A1919|nr:Fic/DOC family N-terminal domain-containing protein [Cellulomonas fimi]